MNALAETPTVPHKLKLTVDDFLMLDASGAFDGYAKTELVEGDIYGMNSQYRRHARIKTRLAVELTRALEIWPELEALVEPSIAIPPHNAPEPDIVVTSEAEGEGLIPLGSVRLVVEVSDSTLRIDLGVKAALYARAGIPEYWVIDVGEETLHQLWSPGEAGYRERRTVPLGATLEAKTVPGLSVELPAG